MAGNTGRLAPSCARGEERVFIETDNQGGGKVGKGGGKGRGGEEREREREREIPQQGVLRNEYAKNERRVPSLARKTQSE